MSLRYSIYKVQTFLSLSLTAFAFYHISFRLSRTFFKFFQTFLICGFARCSVSNFAMLAHLVSFVKHFFQILFKFDRRAVLLAPPAGDLHILAYHLPFVKHFVHYFSRFISDCIYPWDEVLYPSPSDSLTFCAAALFFPGMASGSIPPGIAGFPGAIATAPPPVVRPISP